MMKPIARLTAMGLFMGLLALSGMAHALSPFTAKYDMAWQTVISLRGTAVQSLSMDNGTWTMTQQAEASIGSLSEQSLFRVDTDGSLMPLEFTRNTTVFGRDKVVRARFNWNQDKASWDDQTVALEHGVLDPLTLQLALRQALNARAALNVKVLDRGRIREYQFENLGQVTLSTTNGPIDAVFLRHQRNDRTTELWFDPQRDHLLVRLAARSDNGAFELNLTSADLNPDQVTTTTDP